MAEVSDNGRMWAVLSYGGLLFGLPLGIVPILQRDDAFALFHAKHSLAIAVEFLILFGLYFALFAVAIVAFFLTCGLSHIVMIPLLFVVFFFLLLPYIPAVHGLFLAINGEMQEPIGLFGLSDRLFYNVELKSPETDR